MVDSELKEHISSASTWQRGLFILLFAILYSVAEVVFWAVVLFQFGSQLITGRSNPSLLNFSRGLNAYFYQILQYLSFRSDDKPYPFSDWPSEGLETTPSQPPAGRDENPPPRDEFDDTGETETGV